MRCEHEWRNWPYSENMLCLRCGYMVMGGRHYPLGNPKWMIPRAATIELIHAGIAYVVPETAADALRAALKNDQRREGA